MGNPPADGGAAEALLLDVERALRRLDILAGTRRLTPLERERLDELLWLREGVQRRRAASEGPGAAG
jgi:hypothetical protein